MTRHDSRSSRRDQDGDAEMSNDKPYKPRVDSSSSEISMSIEETNKLRISLGLKPLKVTESEVQKEQVQQQEANTDDEAKQVQKRIEMAKIRRRERELLRTKGLGEDSDDDDSISSFVQKQRDTTRLKKEAEEKARQLEEEELEQDKRPLYTEKDVKNLKVAHDLGNVENVTGDTGIILTLQDRGVLEDGEDALENINLYEQEKRDWNKVNTKKIGAGTGITRGAYNALESLENGGEDEELLSQYDDEKQEMKRKTFVIGDVVNGEAKKKRIQEQEQKAQDEQRYYNLDSESSKPVLAQDFALPKESKKKVSVKKRQAKSGASKKRSSETEVTTETLAPMQDQSQHRGKRRQYSDDHMEVEEQMRKQEREKGFQRALDKAHEQSKILYERESIPYEEEEDPLIRSKLGSLNRNISRVKQEELVQQSVEQAIQREEEEKRNKEAEGVVFNPLTEFVRTVDARGIKEEEDESLARRRRLYEENAKQEPTDHESTVIVKKTIKAKNIKKRGTFDEQEDAMQEDTTEKPKEETEEYEDDPLESETVPLLEEPDIGTGIAAALAYASQKGLLNTDNEFAGRSRDRALSETERKKKRPFNVFDVVKEDEQDEDDDGIDLTRLDKFGRKMTQKQAYRELSHHFHNAFPGKNKRQKEIQRYEEEQRQKQMSSTDTPLKAMEHHEKVTQKLQQPYVIIDSSNLATVAKVSREIQKSEPKRKKARK